MQQLAYCDTIEISDSFYLLVGRHLNLSKREADVANALVYKHDDTCYIIDTGVLLDFRDALIKLCNKLKPYEKIILINSHGHADHTGNNVVIEHLEANSKVHLISTHDYNMMHDNLKFFTKSFEQLVHLTNFFTSASDKVSEMLKMFQPIDYQTSHIKTLEELPTSDICIGNIHWSGWNIDNVLYVCRSQGHSAGHVVFYFPESKHMHLADETTGYCNLFHDCDHLKSLESHTKTLSMLNEGTIHSLSDAHTFKLYNKSEAISFLKNLVESHYVYDHAVQEVLNANPSGLTFSQFQSELTKNKNLLNLPKGANHNPMYSALMLLSKFKDLGIINDGNSNIVESLYRFRTKTL